jgi:hypothetical protein
MDPLGFSLENFDAVGAWRVKDAGIDIDPSGALADGTEVSGPNGLRGYLLRSKTLYLRNFAKHLLTYALGRVVQHYDMPAVRAIAREAEDEGHRFSSIVLGIVRSPAFQLRRVEESSIELEQAVEANQPQPARAERARREAPDTTGRGGGAPRH